MTQTIHVIVDGLIHEIAYSVEDDMLSVYLSEEDVRQTALNGLQPTSALKTHIRSFYAGKSIEFI